MQRDAITGLSFAVGQCWTYRAPPGFEHSRLVIGAIVTHHASPDVVCVSVLNAPQRQPDASIIAITVAFSLAIDSTIHFLNRYHLEEMRLKTGSGAEHTRQTLIKTMHHIGPAVILTTIVLALGLGVTMLSDLPSLRQFGELTAVCLFAALIGQLIILPATTALIRRYIPARK